MTTRHPLRNAAISALLATLLLTACFGEKPEAMIASAKDYLAKNDNKAAIIQIKNALQKVPDSAEARFLLGKALLATGDSAAAEIELRKAQDLKYPSDQIVPLMARTLLASKQFKKLTEGLATADAGTPAAKAELQTIVAVAQYAQGRPEAGQAALQTALASQPDFPPALLIDAKIKAGETDLLAAPGVLDSLLAKGFETAVLQGDTLRSQGKLDAALEAYRKGLEKKPDLVPAHSAIIAILLKQGKNDEALKQYEALKAVAPKSPQTLLIGAQFALQKKDYQTAGDLAQQLLKAVPGSPLALELAGNVEYQKGALVQAQDFLTKALQANEGMMGARRLLTATYLRSGQPGKALETLQPVLDKIGADPAMLGLAGEVYLQNGDLQKAEEMLAKAAKLDPQDSAKRTRLAQTHLAQGRSASAMEELGQIAAADSGIMADLTLISAHIRKNEFDKALTAIDALEKKKPNDPLPLNLRGLALSAKKDIAGARKNFERALAVSPGYFPAASALAGLDLIDKKPDQARQRFESVLAADPKNTQAYLALADLKNKLGGTPDEVAALIAKAIAADPTAANPRLALIGLHLTKKDPKKAVAAAQDALAALPDRPDILDAAGQAQRADGNNNQALVTYGKLATLQPLSPIPHLHLAEIQLTLKDKAAAIASLRKALELKHDFLDAQRGLIVVYLDDGKTKEALAMVKEIQEQRPKEAIGLLLEGDIALHNKAPADAIGAYRRALKLAPGSTELALKLHRALGVAGSKGDADKLAATWVKENPKDLAFRNYLADLALARRDFPGAIQILKGMLDIEPNHPITLNNLAWAAGQVKDPKALEYAERALKAAPNQPQIIDTLAMLLAEKGDLPRALELSKQALDLSQQAPTLRLNYARILLKAGKKAEARGELETLAKLGDRFPEQGEVGKLLKDAQ